MDDGHLHAAIRELQERVNAQEQEIKEVHHVTRKLKKAEVRRQKDEKGQRRAPAIDMRASIDTMMGKDVPKISSPEPIARGISHAAETRWDPEAIRDQFERDTFGVVTMSFTKSPRPSVTVYNSPSSPEIHKVFDELDAHSIGVLSGLEIKKLLCEQHDYSEDIVARGSPFWGAFFNADEQIQDSDSPRKSSLLKKASSLWTTKQDPFAHLSDEDNWLRTKHVSRDEFLVMSHMLFGCNSEEAVTERLTKKISWHRPAQGRNQRLEDFLSEVEHYKNQVKHQTAWYMERTIRVKTLEPIDPERLKECFARALIGFAKAKANAQESKAVQVQARWRGKRARARTPLQTLKKHRDYSSDVPQSPTNKRRVTQSNSRKIRERTQSKVQESNQKRAATYDTKPLVNALKRSIEQVQKIEEDDPINTIHEDAAIESGEMHMYQIVFYENLAHVLGPAEDSSPYLQHLMRVESSKELVAAFFAEDAGKMELRRMSEQLRQHNIQEARAASICRPLLQLLCDMPAKIKELTFVDVPVGSAGLQLISKRISLDFRRPHSGGEANDVTASLVADDLSTRFAACRKTELHTLRLLNTRLADTSMRMSINAKGKEEWRPSGAPTTTGLEEFAFALGSPNCNLKEVEIKGFVTEAGINAFLPSDDNAREHEIWHHITHQKGILFSFDVNSSLTPDNTRILCETCLVKNVGATGNSYEGDGIHHLAEALQDPMGKSITKISIDASRTTDFNVLELLEKALSHERIRQITIVWNVAGGEPLTDLTEELLALNRMPLNNHEYYRLHHCVDFSERHRAAQIRYDDSHPDESVRHSLVKIHQSIQAVNVLTPRSQAKAKSKKKKKKSKLRGRADSAHSGGRVTAQQLVIDEQMLQYPITFALKLSQICNEVANEEDRADKADKLLEVANRFEMIAVKIFDECPNEYVAERVLRGSKPTLLLGGEQDLFTWAIDLQAKPHDFICSKWFQNYYDKVWCHADLSWNIDDILYFGLAVDDDGDEDKSASDAPCDLHEELDTGSTFLYILDYNVVWLILKTLAKTFLLLPAFAIVGTDEYNGNWPRTSRKIGALKCFWSVPKVKYNLHMLSYLIFLIVSMYFISFENPSRLEDWGATKSSEIFTYAYIVSHTVSEVVQMAKKPPPATDDICCCNALNRIRLQIYDHFFCSSIWNIIDALIIIFFLCTLIFRVEMLLNCEREYIDKFSNKCRVRQVPTHDLLIVEVGADDLVEILLGATIVCAFLRAYVIMVSQKKTGVLIIALMRMADDIAVYAVVQIILILAFAMGFVAVFPTSVGLPWYSDLERWGPLDAIGAMALAMFGDYDLEWFAGGDTVKNFMGTALFLLFQLSSSIMLINLLIAMMSHTYDNVQEQALQEWQVEMAGILQDYTHGIHNVLEIPPFNLLRLLGLAVNSVWQMIGNSKKTKVVPLIDETRRLLADGNDQLKMLLKEHSNNGSRGRHRYCASPRVAQLKELQTELVDTIMDSEQARGLELSKSFEGEVFGNLERQYKQLFAYQEEEFLLTKDVKQYRSIFEKPMMSGVVLSEDEHGSQSPYDSDSTVERTFISDDGEEETGVQSLYHNYLDTLEEEDAERAATEEDVKRLIVSELLEIKDAVKMLSKKEAPDSHHEWIVAKVQKKLRR